MSGNEEWLFSRGPLKMNNRAIRVFSRSYMMARIEKVGVRRDPFFMALGVLAPLLLFSFTFSEFLYFNEKIIIWGGSTVTLAALWNVGVLYIQTGSSYSPAAVWKIRDLRDFHDAIVSSLQ